MPHITLRQFRLEQLFGAALRGSWLCGLVAGVLVLAAELAASGRFGSARIFRYSFVLIWLFLALALATLVWRRVTGGTALRSWPLLVPVAVLALEFLWEAGPLGICRTLLKLISAWPPPAGYAPRAGIRVDLLLILPLVYGAIVGGVLEWLFGRPPGYCGLMAKSHQNQSSEGRPSSSSDATAPSQSVGMAPLPERLARPGRRI